MQNSKIAVIGLGYVGLSNRLLLEVDSQYLTPLFYYHSVELTKE